MQIKPLRLEFGRDLAKSDEQSGLRFLIQVQKKTIARRFKRKRKLGLTEAKVGAGVGPRKQQNAGGSRGSRGGVGISKNNAHWYFLGTSQRTTSNGANRGSMPANNAVALGYARSSSAAMSKVKNKTLAVIEREVAKLK